MQKFKDFLNEKIQNTFDSSEKEKYKDEVWDLLQKSYKGIGGIKGSGFESKEDMVEKIPLWKLQFKDGKITSGLLYKDQKGVRKTVTVFTNGSAEGKKNLIKILSADLERSIIEVSHSLLKMMLREMPSLVDKYVIDTKYVQDYIGKEITIINDRLYQREVQGEVITKMLLGRKRKTRKRLENIF